MTTIFKSAWLTAILVTASGNAAAVEPHTEHTFRLEEGESRPAATLADAAWLVGAWDCEAFGARCEETWNAPSAGSMVGLFKLFDDTGVRFYELLLLVEEEGTLVLKVRHFNADFSAWEDKEENVSFRLVDLAPDELHFGGLSFYRRGDDAIDGWIVMRSGDEVKEHALTYRRAGVPESMR